MYYVKATGGNNNLMPDNSTSFGGQIQTNVETIGTNTNTINVTSEENRNIIDINLDNSLNIYSQNISQTGYKNNNRYYYNNLHEYSKVIYDALVNNIDKLKTGNSTIEVDYDFSKVWNNGNGKQDLNNYYDDAINAVILDVPDLFYIDFSKLCLNIKTTSGFFSSKCKGYINSGENVNYFVDGYSSESEVEFAINQVETVKTQVKQLAVGSDYYKIRKIHDWIIDYMSYDASSSARASVYGALVEKKGVCEAYARTYKCVLDEIGIDNILVTGVATNSSNVTENHMWNYVKLNGNWYAVDVTWDDPIIVGGGRPSEEMKHKYFLVGSKEFFKNHTEKLTISPSQRTFPLPQLEVSGY